MVSCGEDLVISLVRLRELGETSLVSCGEDRVTSSERARETPLVSCGEDCITSNETQRARRNPTGFLWRGSCYL